MIVLIQGMVLLDIIFLVSDRMESTAIWLTDMIPRSVLAFFMFVLSLRLTFSQALVMLLCEICRRLLMDESGSASDNLGRRNTGRPYRMLDIMSAFDIEGITRSGSRSRMCLNI